MAVDNERRSNNKLPPTTGSNAIGIGGTKDGYRDGRTPDGSFCVKPGKSKDKLNNRRTYVYSDDTSGREAVVSSSYMRILKTLERSKNENKEMTDLTKKSKMLSVKYNNRNGKSRTNIKI